MSGVIAHHRHYLSQAAYKRSFLFSGAFFLCSIAANYAAGVFATARASGYVEDLILSNIPVVDVGILFVWGAIALIVFVTVLCLMDARRIPFTLYALALFYLIRAGFVTLTHLGTYPDHMIIDEYWIMNQLFGGDDLFFSGHTGAPFMLALVYWREIALRYIFLAWSVFMAVVVLLGHVHYSIDVLSVYFITYSIFQLTRWLFPKDVVRFNDAESVVT
ncbi:MAG: phosphatase PAP2-related protein [bacterium]|nr:phosphatase PAP2-related protein [bacterium]